MDYHTVEASLQALFREFMPLSAVQQGRIKAVCLGVMLAGSTQLTSIARWLKSDNQQASRMRWLQRVLEAPYYRQEYVYRPLIKEALKGYKAKQWHIVMDRTHLPDATTDLLSLNLAFRRRSVPLVWQCMAHGRSDAQEQIGLVKQCLGLIPPGQAVLFHGDAEFDSIPLLRYLQYQHWDFIVGQSSQKVYRLHQEGTWQPLHTLAVTNSRPVYLPHIDLTQTHQFGPLSLFAFYQPRWTNRKHRRDIAYCVSSLPISPALCRLGRRRWSIEPFFQDYKSSGWQLQTATLTHPARQEGLFTTLALTYLWATCFGRWLCKTGHRAEVDAHTHRHLSLFRIGWDWLVHRYATGLPCPTLLTLYQ